MNRLAEKALRVKSEWMVHQAKFLRGVQKKIAQGSVRSSPAQVLVSHCQLFVDVLSSASFVPLPLKVHVAIDSPHPVPIWGGVRSENWVRTTS